MTTRTATLEADLAIIPDIAIGGRTVVALPPSTLDPAADKMRVCIGGVLVAREYDPVLVQP